MLFELPEWIEAKFKGWKWVNMAKQWETQEIIVSIWRWDECSNFGKKVVESKSDKEDTDSSDNSDSFIQKILGNFKK